MSLAAVFEYEVDPAGAAAFEAVYGSDGEWARYFAPADGYLGTELLRAAVGETVHYLVIDRWRSPAAYQAFLDAHADEYASRNEAAKRLWQAERTLGRFEARACPLVILAQAMSRRRACLVVPAAPAAKLAKGATLAADEVVLDLEDAVVPAAKDEARAAVAAALGGEWAAESVAVRVNAIGSPWCHADLVALAASERAALTAVLPKVEHPHDLAFADRLLAGAEAAADRATPVRLLALIETAAGLAAAADIARASERLDGLVLGYADLAASLGRPGGGAAQDWRFAQESVLVAARAAGIQAIDGPHLGTRDDDAFRAGAMHARTLGFDGKWAIHPAQLDALREAFTPTDEEIADAREVLAALERAAADGAGAVARRRPHARRGARAVGAAGAGASGRGR